MTRTTLYSLGMAAVATAAAATFLYKAATVDMELSAERAAKVRAWVERDSIKAERDAMIARSLWWVQHVAQSNGQTASDYSISFVYYQCRPVTEAERHAAAQWLERERKQMKDAL